MAEIHLQGAHVTSWRTAPDQQERLFLSAKSEFREGVAIRGGIPVIFPQFATEGPLPRHGFARTAVWTLAGVDRLPDGEATASFLLEDSPATRAIWPASFLATITVRVGGSSLTVELTIENRGADLFSFTAALHSYLRVRDAAMTELVGLHGAQYRESRRPGEVLFEQTEAIRIEGEIDRVYVGAPSRLTLREPDHELVIETTGFPDVVVWNPGRERAMEMQDMESGGERRMLCVEAAAVDRPVTLDSGRRWSASQTLIAQ